MSVRNAEVTVTLVTFNRHQFFPPASRLTAPISENLLLPLGRIRAAVAVNVLSNSDVCQFSFLYWYWSATQWTNRDLHILLVSRGTLMLVVVDVVLAENILAGVTRQW